MNEMVAAVAGRRPRTMVPLLAAVFIIAWGLLTLLVVMQDRMIDAQSDLIHTFYNQSVSHRATTPGHINSRQANKASGKQAAVPRVRSGKAQSARGQEPINSASAENSVSQIPLSERALSQSPSSQVKPKANDKSGRGSRKARSPFSAPPAEITDPSDQRRVSITI